jgi:hypothetical protein
MFSISDIDRILFVWQKNPRCRNIVVYQIFFKHSLLHGLQKTILNLDRQVSEFDTLVGQEVVLVKNHVGYALSKFELNMIRAVPDTFT